MRAVGREGGLDGGGGQGASLAGILAQHPALRGGLSDLNMLVATGGRERTSEECAALFAAAGFRFVVTIRTAGGMAFMEGAPA